MDAGKPLGQHRRIRDLAAQTSQDRTHIIDGESFCPHPSDERGRAIAMEDETSHGSQPDGITDQPQGGAEGHQSRLAMFCDLLEILLLLPQLLQLIHAGLLGIVLGVLRIG